VIDTAECYRKSEEMIGNTVSHRRGTTICSPSVDTPAGLKIAELGCQPTGTKYRPEPETPQDDYIDVIQLHGCSRRLLKRAM